MTDDVGDVQKNLRKALFFYYVPMRPIQLLNSTVHLKFLIALCRISVVFFFIAKLRILTKNFKCFLIRYFDYNTHHLPNCPEILFIIKEKIHRKLIDDSSSSCFEVSF